MNPTQCDLGGAPHANPNAGYCRPGRALSQGDLRLLQNSAIDPIVACERDYYTELVKARSKEKGLGALQGLIIPLRNALGEIVGYQLRPHQPPTNKQGKLVKYVSGRGSELVIDVPWRLSQPRPYQSPGTLTELAKADRLPKMRKAMIADGSIPVVLTEGARKADSAVSRGLCAISLSGVSAWHRAPGWNDFPIRGRTFYLTFDSDAMTKRQVWVQLSHLKAWLESRGAIIKIIYLPPEPNGQKVGLDDFIAELVLQGLSDGEVCANLLALASDELRPPPVVGEKTSGRPTLTLIPGQIPAIIDEAEQVLLANNPRLQIFQRGGEVVRVVSLKREDSRNGLRREVGSVQLVSVSTLGLLEVFDREIAFTRTSEDGEIKPAYCPTSIPARYLARRSEWKIPTLRGVIESPILRPDGTILRYAGYDDATGLFLHSELDWSDLAEPRGLAEAQRALQILSEPFSEFPFIDEAAKSVFLACILTALQRRLLEPAPLFGFTAPDKRTGKSMLAESVGIIALGRKPAAAGVSTQQDEFRKAITSSLREGHLIVNLDNISQPLGSPDLVRAITQSIYEDRLLGANQMLRLPTNLLWTATGNNLTFKGDLPSRALLCGIDAEVERPEEREFKIADLPAYLHEHRKELVAAALTIMRAYEVDGWPRQNLKPWGGFSQWSRSIREPLVWLGLADPCQTREQIISSDPERELNADVLSNWYEAFGDRKLKVNELINELLSTGDTNIALRRAVLAVAADRKTSDIIDPRRLGSWCRANEGKIINGFRLKRTGEYRRAITWRVSPVSCVSPKTIDPNEDCVHAPQKGGAAEYIVDRPETDSHNSQNSHGNQVDEEGFEV